MHTSHPATVTGTTAPAPRPSAAVSDTTRAIGPKLAADSTQRRLATADTTRASKFQIISVDTTRRLAPSDPKGFERPRWVMLRSLAFPGWGQAHNGSWTKAALIAGVEGLFITRIVQDKRALNRLDGDIASAESAGDSTTASDLIDQFNTRSNTFVAHQWWLGAALAYSLLDAYIDAHFRNFRIDMEDDPALPPDERHAAGLKLSWQEHF